MSGIVVSTATWVATATDYAAMAVFAAGATRALVLFTRDLVRKIDPFPPEELRLGVARTVALGLELVLVSTFLRIVGREPDWHELGTLAALLAIKIAVNFVLVREVREESEVRRREEKERARSEQGGSHGPTPTGDTGTG